ncbi:MAG TPA: ABC transporter substrate-binding protein, partial [Acidimicrobiales bacterium]|nr:ABC transporter substrate-binding protein [Acidimicrobiales bacterium]
MGVHTFGHWSARAEGPETANYARPDAAKPTMEVSMRAGWKSRGGRVVTCAAVAASLVGTAGASAANAGTIKVPTQYASGIKVAVDATYPPDEFMRNGKIVGFDADLAQALSSALGVKLELEDATFDTIIAGVEDGKYGIGDSSFTDNKSREKSVDFVDYFVAGEAFYENSSSKLVFNGLHSLCGHSVSVESGTTEQTDAQTQAKTCKVTVESFGNQDQANLAVETGRAQVGFADSQVAAYIVHLSDGQFKLTGTAFSTAPYGFIVAKNSGLLQPLYEAFKVIFANGQYKKILDSW